MATKQEKSVHRAFLLGVHKGKIREEKHILWFLIALILILLYLLGAQSFGWWPFAPPTLGSAFYTNVGPRVSAPAGMTTDGSGSQSGDSSGGSNGGSSSAPSGSGSIANFAAGVNVGNTKAQTSSQARGLGQNCAVVVDANASTGGKQEVCTYSQGDKIVTVTYLNDRVISASKSGF